MLWEEAQRRTGQLRELCKLFASGGGRERIDELIDLAGALFDGSFLDGEQYAALHDLDEALRAGAADARERAAACVAML